MGAKEGLRCRETFWKGRRGLGQLALGSRASSVRAARTTTCVIRELAKPDSALCLPGGTKVNVTAVSSDAGFKPRP